MADFEGWALLNVNGDVIEIRRTRAECIDYGRWFASDRKKTWRQLKKTWGLSVRRVSAHLHPAKQKTPDR